MKLYTSSSSYIFAIGLFQCPLDKVVDSSGMQLFEELPWLTSLPCRRPWPEALNQLYKVPITCLGCLDRVPMLLFWTHHLLKILFIDGLTLIHA